MKKIALISELYGTKRQGGENQAMFGLFNYLIKKNYECSFYSYISPDKNIKRILPISILIIPFIRDIFFSPFLSLLIKKIQKKYNEVIVSSTTAGLFLSSDNNVSCWVHACRTMKSEKFIKQNKYFIIYNPLTFLIIRFLEIISFRKYKKIYVITKDIYNYLINVMRVDPKKIILASNFVDSELFYKYLTKKEYDYIFVGRGTKQKGFDIFLEIAKNNPNKKFLSVLNLIETDLKNILPNNVLVKFKVSNRDMPCFYNKAKMLILPSRDEEQPLSVIEALSCGLSVLGSKEALKNFGKLKLSSFSLYTICNKEIWKKNLITKYFA
ncbi:MAG TPA: glycosyltransferase family 4 protein [Candidatus Woesebacteria bacterium]|nr:glycosyltransferase family 4 protein [Candidatus Woesebacteria bacterium]